MLKAYELSPLAFLLLVNVLLLILGCFLEGTTILLVIVPVLLPTAQALGIDLVHFGVMAVVNIMLGLITPPYGLLLFIMVKIADVPLRDIVRDVMPFLCVMIGALALITFVPGLVLLLPRLLGYTGLMGPGAQGAVTARCDEAFDDKRQDNADCAHRLPDRGVQGAARYTTPGSSSAASTPWSCRWASRPRIIRP